MGAVLNENLGRWQRGLQPLAAVYRAIDRAAGLIFDAVIPSVDRSTLPTDVAHYHRDFENSAGAAAAQGPRPAGGFGMQPRHLVISADGHAGPPADVYRGYLDPGFRERFDVFQQELSDLRAEMEDRTAAFQAEWEEETGGDGGLTAAFDSATRNAVLDEEGVACEVLFPDADVLGHRAHRRLAVRHRPGRGQHRRRGGRGRQPGPQPVAVGLRGRGAASPHRRGRRPGHHPRHGHGADHRGRGQGAGPLRGSSSRTRWFERPAYHDPHYEPLWALAEELELVVHTHSGAGPTDIGLGPGMLGIYASEAGWWAARPLAVLIWGGIFERHPEPALLDGRERGLVGARSDPQDGREVGGRAQHPQVRGGLPGGPVHEAQRVPRPQLLLRRLHAREWTTSSVAT